MGRANKWERGWWYLRCECECDVAVELLFINIKLCVLQSMTEICIYVWYFDLEVDVFKVNLWVENNYYFSADDEWSGAEGGCSEIFNKWSLSLAEFNINLTDLSERREIMNCMNCLQVICFVLILWLVEMKSYGMYVSQSVSKPHVRRFLCC